MDKRKHRSDLDGQLGDMGLNSDVNLTEDQQVYFDIIKECIIENSEFSEIMVSIIMDDSSFKELLPSNEDMSHRPPEYWANYILKEHMKAVRNVLRFIKSN